MGQKVILFDDLDESISKDVARRTFAIGDTTYEIELTDANWQEFIDRTAEFVAVARTVESVGERLATRSRKRKGRPEAPPPPPEPVVEPPIVSTQAEDTEDLSAEVRAWARKNGFDIGDRGRIPQEVWTEHRRWKREHGLIPANGRNGAHLS